MGQQRPQEVAGGQSEVPFVWKKYLARKSKPSAPPKAMEVPALPLTLTRAEAMTRQIEGAIEALVRGRFDIALTLAGAAEGMSERHGLFAYQRDHPKAKEQGIEKELVDHATKERNWLKHPQEPDTMEITRYSAAFMIARAVTKLDPNFCTPPITAFCHWWVENHK
jgi:hypothetical protein